MFSIKLKKEKLTLRERERERRRALWGVGFYYLLVVIVCIIDALRIPVYDRFMTICFVVIQNCLCII